MQYRLHHKQMPGGRNRHYASWNATPSPPTRPGLDRGLGDHARRAEVVAVARRQIADVAGQAVPVAQRALEFSLIALCADIVLHRDLKGASGEKCGHCCGGTNLPSFTVMMTP